MIRRASAVQRALKTNISFRGQRLTYSQWYTQSTAQPLTGVRKRTSITVIQPLSWRRQRRGLFEGMVTFLNSHVHPVFFPPALFVALLLTLWVQKCIMMVIFQNKIIYMPGLPPDSRQEKIKDYRVACRPVVWSEETITSIDGKRLALCIGRVERQTNQARPTKSTLILYFQGNGSSTPPRLPILSRILASANELSDTQFNMAALSYRGYWHSSGRPSQKGIEKDAKAFLTWARQTHPDHGIVLWGQSIGAGIATNAAAEHVKKTDDNQHIEGLILETPFVSVRRMLAALYPERWVPYRYLWPFLRNWWDSEQALRDISTASHRPPILLVPAGKDEVVPAPEADYLEALCKDMQLAYQRKDVVGALHNEASTKASGKQAIVEFLCSL